MSITNLLNPELSRQEPGEGFIAKLLETIIDEIDREVIAVGEAYGKMLKDEERHKNIGRSFGRKWDPLKEIGIVSQSTIENSAEIVREMAIDPIEQLRDQVDVEVNNSYLDGIVTDSFLDKDQALKNAEAAFTSANYTPVKFLDDVAGY